MAFRDKLNELKDRSIEKGKTHWDENKGDYKEKASNYKEKAMEMKDTLRERFKK